MKQLPCQTLSSWNGNGNSKYFWLHKRKFMQYFVCPHCGMKRTRWQVKLKLSIVSESLQHDPYCCRSVKTHCMQSRTQRDVQGGVTEITAEYPDFSKMVQYSISKNSLLHNNFTISNNKIGWVGRVADFLSNRELQKSTSSKRMRTESNKIFVFQLQK